MEKSINYDIVLALIMLDELKRVLSQNREYEVKCIRQYISTIYNVIPHIPAIEQTMLVELADRLDRFIRAIEDDERITAPILATLEKLLTGGETE